MVTSVEVLPAEPSISLETRSGQPLDETKVRNDVKTLWRSGKFSDVRVEETGEGKDLHVVFHVEPKPKLLLRRIDVEPPTPGIDIQLPANTQMDDYAAQLVATSVQKQLVASGYGSAKVTARLTPAGADHVDLKVDIDRGDRVDVGPVTLAGDLGEPGLKPRKALKWTSSKTMIPAIPGIWKGWHVVPGFNDIVMQNDAANLTSYYYSRGYFDANVNPSATTIAGGKAGVRFDIQAGPRYFVRNINVVGGEGATQIEPSHDGTFPVQQLCKAMLDERRRAERAGVLDFSARVEARDVPAPETQIGSGTHEWVDLTATVERGPRYKIGRIEFVGSTSFTDRTYRRAMIFDEGDPLDEYLLRKSLARLNNTGLFEPLSQADVVVNTPSGTDRADLTIRLRERKSRQWYFSGPVGPLSLGDSLQFAIGSRLPPWGKRVIDLATFTASIHLMFFAKPLGSVLPGFSNRRFQPILQLSRPLLPGQFLISGFSVSPQLGWQGVLLGYGASQTRNLLSGVLESPRSYTPPLTVSVVHTGPVSSGREGAISCEMPKTKLDWVKQITDITTRFAFSFFPF
jgi:outer membrane protein assembly factor BamA